MTPSPHTLLLLLALLSTFLPTSAASEDTFHQLIDQATAYQQALQSAPADNPPTWSDFVPQSADASWDLLARTDPTLLDALSPELNALLHRHVWSASSAHTPWMLHNLWILLAAALVFVMHLGFCTLESGLCQAKNTVNILFKNCWIISIGLLTYYLWGFQAQYPGDFNGFIALGSPASYPPNQLLTKATALYHSHYTWWADFIFQAMFAATAATIVSGAVAERIKLQSFMVFSILLVGIAYPLAGSWHWGGGFLQHLPTGPFHDFAGSTVVHAFGGCAALASVLILGPRRGKYTPSGLKPILPHNLPLATIGVFLLFFGWFGFNGGSVLSAEPHLLSLVFVNTALAAATGGLASIFTAWLVIKKPDLSMSLNGLLAGLVGITAGADTLSPNASLLVGAGAGVLVVFSILWLDRLKLDDPVGAISVHGVCGIWGTLAVAFTSAASFFSQLLGILCIGLFAFLFTYATFRLLQRTLGIRVDQDEEYSGLDVAEHGSPAYHLPQD